MLAAELGAAFTLLTRLPTGALIGGRAVVPGHAVWAYPIVGAAAGAIAGGVNWLCAWLGLPPALAAFWTVAAAILVTGGLHEDGLADTADGFGGGATRARKLEIMRDSRIGSYGALALVVSTGARVTALALLTAPDRVWPALIAAGALSRGMLAIPLLLLRPARPDGLAAPLGERAIGRNWAAMVIAAVIAWVMLPLASAALSVGLSVAAACAVAGLGARQVGGYTGDVLGACVLTVECVVLTGLVAG